MTVVQESVEESLLFLKYRILVVLHLSVYKISGKFNVVILNYEKSSVKRKRELGVLAHACNPSTLGG